ncbi:beclin-1 [Acrodontium crateriforme]|uniref:Beclin-1 n=1 Tax=Acrodontium crateriforme TaxID=150365 RepID=A0AAQ3M716_9PEZI|nr:beclin-1 [Acrodontium crateriforme]
MAALQCQKCRTSLRIDGTLEDLNPASFNILADAAPALEPKAPSGSPSSAAARERRAQYDDVSRQTGATTQRKSTSPTQRITSSNDPPDMSYIVLTESQLSPEGRDDVASTSSKKKNSTTKIESSSGKTESVTQFQQLETAARLFEILSARSDIDHPICSECTELILDGLQKRQASVLHERDAYVGFLKQAQDNVPTDEEKARTKRDLEDAQQREKKALEELEALEAEKARMEAEIAALDAEAEQLDEEEEQFWRERNAFTMELTARQEERDSLQNQLAHDTKVLESLQRTNVYNDTFCISHDGHFATINGLRLGRLAEHAVGWAEINAALGQALLLLAVVSEKLGIRLKGVRLLPIGSTSKIIKEADPQGDGKEKTFELYSSGDLPLGLTSLFQGKFDGAMVEYLGCIRQLGEHVERTSTRGLKMPYKISKDKIGDVSIKLSYGHEDQWTKACKYSLTCCKFLLAHASYEDDAKYASR